MTDAIEIAMDGSGRVVIPKAVREAAGLVAGMPLAVTVTSSGVEIAPAPRAVRPVRRGRLTVAVPSDAGDRLSSRAVRETLLRVRRQP